MGELLGEAGLLPACEIGAAHLAMAARLQAEGLTCLVRRAPLAPHRSLVMAM